LTSDNLKQKTKEADFKLVEGPEDARAQVVYCQDLSETDDLRPTGQNSPTAKLDLPAPSVVSPSYGSGNVDMTALFREDTFWERRGRQIFNAVYFTSGLVAVWFVAASSDFLMFPATVLCWFVCLLALQSFIYATFSKAMLGPSNVFSLRTQKNLRRAALITPFVFMVVAASNMAGLYMHANMHNAARGGQLPAGAMENMLIFSPLNSTLISHLYDDAIDHSLHPQALMLAERMSVFHPLDTHWKIRRLASLAFIPGREAEFDRLTKEYTKTMADDGFLWNTLADIAVARQDWPVALELANEHVRIHDNERLSYEQRAAIEKELGMIEEAESDLDRANSIGSGH